MIGNNIATFPRAAALWILMMLAMAPVVRSAECPAPDPKGLKVIDRAVTTVSVGGDYFNAYAVIYNNKNQGIMEFYKVKNRSDMNGKCPGYKKIATWKIKDCYGKPVKLEPTDMVAPTIFPDSEYLYFDIIHIDFFYYWERSSYNTQSGEFAENVQECGE